MKNGGRSPVRSRKVRHHKEIKGTSSVRSYAGSVNSGDQDNYDLVQSQKVITMTYIIAP